MTRGRTANRLVHAFAPGELRIPAVPLIPPRRVEATSRPHVPTLELEAGTIRIPAAALASVPVPPAASWHRRGSMVPAVAPVS